VPGILDSFRFARFALRLRFVRFVPLLLRTFVRCCYRGGFASQPAALCLVPKTLILKLKPATCD
jgi:hypothetical protein